MRFTARVAADEAHACHCRTCRRWGGGPALAVDATDLRIEDAASVTVYRSSDWAERAFCARCGAHLFYRLVETGAVTMNVGAFDDDGGFALTQEIFIDAKPGGYAFAGERPRLTAAQTLALFGGADGGGAP